MTKPSLILRSIIRMLHLLLVLGPRCVHCFSLSQVRRRVILKHHHHHFALRWATSSNLHESSSALSSSHVPSPSGFSTHVDAIFTPRSTMRMRMIHSTTTASGTDSMEYRDVYDNDNNTNHGDDDDDSSSNNTSPNNFIPPWSLPSLKSASSKTYSRFRQHVNPLSRRYSMAAELPPNWPTSVFDNMELPLYLDIGCGKGGFLLELAGSKERCRMNVESNGDVMSSITYDYDDDNELKEVASSSSSIPSSSYLWPLPSHMNYLGLEIRPGVSQYAQARVTKRKLDGVVSFVGCNANVDLDRLLTLYHGGPNTVQGNNDDVGLQNNNNNHHRRLAFVSIQFPDPHFKKAHTKRRVVTSQLVSTLAKFMEEGSAVFLQSDIKDALVGMREKFVDEEEEEVDENVGDADRAETRRNENIPLGASRYFDEIQLPNGTIGEEEYGMTNPLGVPTEREKSVLANGLPVYRTMFQRNGIPYESS